MKCPKCGFQQADSRTDCEFCGLVFAKWKAKQEATQKAAEAKPPEAPAPSAPMDTELKNQTIPDNDEGPANSYSNPQRIFELLGSLYLQRNSGGVWIYFPGVYSAGVTPWTMPRFWAVSKVWKPSSAFFKAPPCPPWA